MGKIAIKFRIKKKNIFFLRPIFGLPCLPFGPKIFLIFCSIFYYYLKAQIGNPEGDDIPNKKYYDPRKWMREGELTFVTRLSQAFEDLNNVQTL